MSGALEAIYSVDFTALPGQGSFAQGAITVDGLRWYAKNGLTGLPSGTVMQNDLTAGQGIRFQSNATGIPLSPGAVSYPYRHLFLPLSNIPDFNPAAPTIFTFRGVQQGWGGNNFGLVCGLVSSTNDGTALAAVDRQYDALVHTYEAARSYKRGTGTESSATGINNQFFNRAFGVYNFMGAWTIEVSDPSDWTGTFSDPWGWISASTPPPFATNARPNPGIFVGIRGQVATSSVYLTHLAIMQPEAPVAPDLVPPTVGEQSPAPGSNLTKYQPVSFKVSDETRLAFSAVFAEYRRRNGSVMRYDVVWDGLRGSDLYNVTREGVTGGYRYTVLCKSGWPAAPRFIVRAVDGGGTLDAES